MIPDEIRTALASANSVLVITHVNPDGDAIGSCTGLGWILQALGKQHTLSCQDPVPEIYQFVPGSDRITAAPSGNFDLVMSVDASDPARLGHVYQGELRSLALINIDHHVTNLNFGGVNWVEPRAASACEMVYDLARWLPVPIDTLMATSLLTGILTDTRHFRTSNVTPHVLEIARDLIEAGAPLLTITENVEQRSLAQLKLWGEALPQLQQHGRVVWVPVTTQMRQVVSAQENDASGLVSFLVSVKEADVAVVFLEKGPEEVEAHFRSKPGWNVAGVAVSLGGGGHPQASGCTIHLALAEAEQRVLDTLDRDLAAQDAAAKGAL